MIIDGKKIAEVMETELKVRLENAPPKKVAFVLFGDDLASKKFMQMKERVAARIGVTTSIFERSVATTEDAVSFVVGIAENYDGIVVQLPIPAMLDSQKIISAIPLEKDIDLLNDVSMRDFELGQNPHMPPVARAVFEILEKNSISFANKKILVIGNGKLVGAPVAAMCNLKKITYTQIDKNTDETKRMKEIKNADIIISGVGLPHFIKPEMVKENVILIDAGTSEQEGKLAGDIDPACAAKASFFTPVPGGVGPVTVVSLFYNLL